MSNTRTYFASGAQLAGWLGCPQPQSDMNMKTLNAKFGVFPEMGLSQNETSKLCAITMGTGGLQFTTVGTRARQSVVPHKATDAAAFEPLPFVIREVNNDLSAQERSMFGLRQLREINGVQCVVYNALMADFTSAVITEQKLTTINGTTTPSVLIPTEDFLTPVPTVVSVENVNPLQGISVAAIASLPISMSAFVVEEVLNAARIFYGSEDDAYITELQLVQGVKRQVTADSGTGGSTITYNELIAAQVAQHIASRIHLPDYRIGYEAVYELGGTDKLFVLGSGGA